MKQSFLSQLQHFLLATGFICLFVGTGFAAEKFSVDADHSKVGLLSRLLA